MRKNVIRSEFEARGALPSNSFANSDDGVSVNERKSAITLNAQDVDADPVGTAASAVKSHEGKTSAHPISGVAGLEARLVELQSKITDLESWPQVGNNINGTWRKHKDGTLECWYRGPVEFGATNPYGTLFQATGTWNFPAPFIDVPVINAPVIQIRTAAVWSGIMTIDAEKAKIRYFDVTSSSPGTGTVSISAIGRWK